MIGACGAVATRWIAAPRVSGTAKRLLVQTAARVGLAAGVCLPVAMAGLLWRQFADFRDPFSPWAGELRLLVAGTSWGRAWIGATAAALAALTAFVLVAVREAGADEGRARGESSAADNGAAWRWAAAAALSGGLCVFTAFAGHAAGTGVRWLSLPADAIHVLAAGAWTGGLLVVVATERAARRGGGASALPAIVPAFSPLALGAAAVLACTGAVLAFLHLGSLPALVHTAWGRTFLVKLLLVTAVLALGAWNWKRLGPALNRPGGPDALRRAAVAELALAQAVVLATALLTGFSPPASGSGGATGH